MNIFKQYQVGLSSFFKAIPFIFKHKLGWFFLFPIGLQILFLVGGAIAIGELVDMTMLELNAWWGIDTWEFPLSEYLGDAIYVFLWLLLKITFFLVFSYFSGYIVLIFLSPILAYLSERTERILSGKEYPFNIFQLMRDVARGVVVVIRNLALELLLTLVIFLIGFIPVVNLITPFLFFGVTAYYYGFSFMDYNNERRLYPFKKSVRLMRKNKAVLVGVASPFTGLLIIPIIGQWLAGLAAIIATVGGVIAYQEIEKSMEVKVTEEKVA